MQTLRIGYNQKSYPVRIKEDHRFLNGITIGKTGAGKSSLLLNFWEQDCWDNVAKAIIVPSGFMAREAYSMVRGKVKYLHLDHPVAINPMMLPFDQYQIASNVVQIIDQLIAGTGTSNLNLTSNMKRLVNEGTIACLDQPRPRLDALVDWLRKQRGNQEAREGVINRLEMVLGNPKMRDILCTEETIDYGKFTEEKDTLVVDCQGMSDEEMVITGTTITHSIKSHLQFSRKKEYFPLAIYVDEAHRFVSPNWYSILKEGRKYKLAAMLATQDFASIPEQLARVMLSNCGTLIAFKCGYREAQLMGREFQTLTPEEIQFLPKYHCAVKTPDEEGIVKTPHPPIVKEKPLTEPVKSKGWFPLRPTVQKA